MILLKKQKGRRYDSSRLVLLLMALPCIVLVLMFNYVPLFGWLYGFFDYKPGYPLFKSEFVGFKYFRIAFSDISILMVLRNTLVLGGLTLAVSVLPPLFAIFLNELRGKFLKKVFQVLTTIPNFISWTIVFSIFYMFLSVEDGLVNDVLLGLGFIQEPLNLLGDVDAVWPLQTLILVWKTLGFQAIFYLAAISGIDPELYDAADVDGAGRFSKIRNITIPFLLPTYFVLFIMGVGLILSNGFDQYYLFKNSLVYDKIMVLDVYLYDVGLKMNQYSLSTVLGISKTLISVVLLFGANTVIKWWRGTSII